jgi:dTDP-4-dehydrorhamnose 3,5-epimerase
MEFKEQKIKGVYEIVCTPHLDDRGYFMRVYDKGLFEKYDLHREWIQENHSRSVMQGIIRGLHYQLEPYSEAKLIRCIRGSIFDVAVDVRFGSETFGQWIGIELSEEKRNILFIPRGFAHGFCTLTDISEVVYKVDNTYSRLHEQGIIWNDIALNICWPVENPVLSEKDKTNLPLSQARRVIV